MFLGKGCWDTERCLRCARPGRDLSSPRAPGEGPAGLRFPPIPVSPCPLALAVVPAPDKAPAVHFPEAPATGRRKDRGFGEPGPWAHTVSLPPLGATEMAVVCLSHLWASRCRAAREGLWPNYSRRPSWAALQPPSVKAGPGQRPGFFFGSPQCGLKAQPEGPGAGGAPR